MLRKQHMLLKNQHQAARLFALALLSIPGLTGSGSAPLTVIPLKIGENYRLYASARINGSAFTCSMDSGGGNRISLDKAKAAAAGIQPTGEGRSAGPQATQMVRDDRARVSLEIGSLKLDDQVLVIGNRPTPGFECVIGMSVFAGYVVELSYDRSELRIFDAANYQYSDPGKAVAFTTQQWDPFVTVTLQFPKGDPVIAKLAIDTGGGRPAGYLSKSFVEQHNLMSLVSRAVPDFGSGMSGGEPRVVASRLGAIKLGDVEMRGPIFYFLQLRGFGGQTEPDGMLCPDFLRRYTVIFDYPRQRLILEPGLQFASPMPFDASGLAVYRQIDDYRIWKVIVGSPAAEAGIREGDTLLEMDGRRASEMSLEEITKSFERDGRTCTLRVRRGGEELVLKLALHRLI
jgi:hypothetical protein